MLGLAILAQQIKDWVSATIRFVLETKMTSKLSFYNVYMYVCNVWSSTQLYSSGEVLGALCAKLGPQIYSRTRSKILGGIQTNLERQPLSDSGHVEQEDREKLVEKLSSSPSRVCIGHIFSIFVMFSVMLTTHVICDTSLWSYDYTVLILIFLLMWLWSIETRTH